MTAPGSNCKDSVGSRAGGFDLAEALIDSDGVVAPC